MTLTLVFGAWATIPITALPAVVVRNRINVLPFGATVATEQLLSASIVAQANVK